MKQFKAESKRLLDLMINSIYTNKEIFLRELISNASDALDKLYYKSITESDVNINKSELCIKIEIDKENRLLKIKDNGCGMNAKELENNLGTIAKSGSLAFKAENEKKEDVDIIGQFGVGFYSAFMVADEVTVRSKAFNTDEAYEWKSKGIDGYSIEKIDKQDNGTEVILHIKEDEKEKEEEYNLYLETFKIEKLIKKYSDYIKYPIKMNIEHSHKKEGTENEYETIEKEEILNSMIPLWKKKKNEIKKEEYDSFYTTKFHDFEKPSRVIHTSVEGSVSYKTLLFMPSHLPYDFYSKDYEKGLQLYSNGVLIMDKCADLLPDYFGFVKGLVDSDDLSLNISRETLQQNRQLKAIAKSIEKKINAELELMLKENREEYEKLFSIFGVQIKYGTYSEFGANKDKLKDLLLFHSSKENKLVTLKEYVQRMKEGQDKIYYACGESIDKIDLLPQVELVKEKDYEILYLTDDVDEFALKILQEYDKKEFISVSADNIDLDTEEEKVALEALNEANKEMFKMMSESLTSVNKVRFTHRLKNHPVCLATEGAVSIEMEKVLSQMPNNQNIKAETILEINENHKIVEKLKQLYKEDPEELKSYTKILYNLARMIEGLSVENPTELTNLICDIM